MKLIRTLIDNKRSSDNAPGLRPSQIAEKPLSSMSRPVSKSLRARTILSQRLDARVQDFKLDLVELTPSSMTPTNIPKPKRVWDVEAEVQSSLNETAQVDDVEAEDLATQEVPEIEDAEDARPPSDMRPDRKASALRILDVPDPLQPRRALPSGRTKTRIMGFGDVSSPDAMFDSFEQNAELGLDFPIGWLVITDGPGRGKAFVLQHIVSTIGRALDQTISLNYGDDTISRNNHAAVAYDDQMNTFYLGFGGKANLVRLNGRPVLGTEQLSHGDTIRVGETDLRFIALCGPDFSWDEDWDGADA